MLRAYAFYSPLTSSTLLNPHIHSQFDSIDCSLDLDLNLPLVFLETTPRNLERL